MRFLVQYLVVTIVLVATVWLAALYEINGQTLLSHFLGSPVGTRVKGAIRQFAGQPSTSSAEIIEDRDSRASVSREVRRTQPAPKPRPVVRAQAPVVGPPRAPPGPPWVVQTDEGAYRRVAALEAATEKAGGTKSTTSD